MFENLIVTCTLFSFAIISSARFSTELLVGRSEASMLVLVCWRRLDDSSSVLPLSDIRESSCCDEGRAVAVAVAVVLGHDADVESVSMGFVEA